MHRPSVRTITWGLRFLYAGIVFWWPALLQDPIYTPRYARLTGQELHLPTKISSGEEEGRALAIFWNWENRTLVSTRWFLGPYRGIRASEGRAQTLIVLLFFWIASSLLLSRLDSPQSPIEEPPRQRRLGNWLSTPIWRWFTRRT
jgi:hypothetical protein